MALGIRGSENVIVIQMRDPGGGNEVSDRALGDLLVSDVREAEVRGAEASGPEKQGLAARGEPHRKGVSWRVR